MVPAGLAGLAVILLVGCAAAPPASTPATAPAAPSTRPDPVAACTTQLVYWAGEKLRGADDGGDYQHHGLTSEQNDALDGIVADAQAHGADRVPADAREACARIVAANPTPSGF